MFWPHRSECFWPAVSLKSGEISITAAPIWAKQLALKGSDTLRPLCGRHDRASLHWNRCQAQGKLLSDVSWQQFAPLCWMQEEMSDSWHHHTTMCCHHEALREDSILHFRIYRCLPNVKCYWRLFHHCESNWNLEIVPSLLCYVMYNCNLAALWGLRLPAWC